ncbi:hypothetical protein QFK30_003360 [Listeria monocytogenes]|uniref:hypothetical protein n=1 Tax=Listeria monocytogenes TaxID=1639 RepID=UPI0024569AF0|nr:hypothetical protein [Listeria monocytogenes]WKN63475.1 hypothetical protein QFK30_003360 [Listeria monocytogenes]HDB4668415.1 hypothetical protein [Listeria monocytogenes]
MRTKDKKLLNLLAERSTNIQYQIASLAHTKKCSLAEALTMTDAEVESLFVEMRMELDS